MPVGIGEKLQGSNEQEVAQRYRRVLEGLLGIPATGGNRVDVLRNGVQIFPAMLEAIADARHTVDFATYIYWTGGIADRFAEALSDRARAGVRVRVLLDAIGALKMTRGHDSMRRPVHVDGSAGYDVKRLRDTHNERTARVICDVRSHSGRSGREEWDGDARTRTNA